MADRGVLFFGNGGGNHPSDDMPTPHTMYSFVDSNDHDPWIRRGYFVAIGDDAETPLGFDPFEICKVCGDTLAATHVVCDNEYIV